jgi:PilZ domain
MAEKRQHKRINCAEKCLLYHDNTRYNCAIMNISISGALLKIPGFTPGAINPGDTCSFILSNNPTTSFYRYKGRIARVNPAELGLEILEHEF